MNFAQFSVTRPVAVTMRIAALVLLGAVCFTRLPVDLLPRVSLPTVAVSMQWPNVAPEEIETQLTRLIERAVSSVPNLYQISSSTTEGSSWVRLQFNWGTDMNQAAIDVLQQVQRVKRQLPNDPTLQDPLVFKFDPSQQPILTIGVSGMSDTVKLRSILDNEVAPILESADGVASVSVTGGDQRAIMVAVDPDRLRAHEMSLSDLTRRIAEENRNVPAGNAKEGNSELTIRTLGWFTKPSEIGRVPLRSVDGSLVTVNDVATVADTHTETRVHARLNGEPAVGIVVTKQSGANTIGAANAVYERVEQVRRIYPDLAFTVAYDQSKFIANSMSQLQHHAVMGGILAVLILLFFLRNIRSTLVVALSIPISIVSTFTLLYLGGFSINTMSLSGLALATGLIVDDAVVVLENIFRHIERDKKRAADAAVGATNEIITAVIASTSTVIVVFLPLLLIRGQAGQMFAEFALVVMFAMAVSLLDAATVVPMLSSRFISGDAHRELMEDGHRRGPVERLFAMFGRWLTALDASYRRGLVWAIGHRPHVIGGAILISLASFVLVPLIGTELMPQADSGDLNLSLKMPVGTSLERTNRAMLQVERILKEDPHVETVFATAGANVGSRGINSSGQSHQGSAIVRLKPGHPPSQEVIARLRRQMSAIAGAKANISQVDPVSRIISGGNQNLEVDIFGGDVSTLSALARDSMAKLRGIPGLENVDVNIQEATPEIQWRVDREKAAQANLSFEKVAAAINTATNGAIAGYYQEAGYQYPIVVQVKESRRHSVDQIAGLPLVFQGPNGKIMSVPLRQVAAPTYAMGPSELTRLNRQRYIAVTGTPQGRSAGEVQEDITKALAGLPMPSGYYWDWGADQKRRGEEFAGMGLAIVFAIILIYMLLASQFESFIHPLTVLCSVPLTSIGVVLAFFLTGRTFGLTAFIGVLMLVGIAVKNGILLVDYTNVLRGRGMLRNDAVLTAAPTRLRPILMTTCATMFGMLPIALGLGEGSETQAPMATAVMGGLITSSAMTLFVVPVVYTLFDDFGRRLLKDTRDLSASELVEPTVEAIAVEPSVRESRGGADG